MTSPSLRSLRGPTRRRLTALVWSLLGWIIATGGGAGSLARAQPRAEEAATPATIRRFGEFWEVPAPLRSTMHPIEMEVSVHYYDPVWGLLWGENEGEHGFVPCGDVPLPIEAGQRVRLTGSVQPSRGLSGRTIDVTALGPVDTEAVPLPAGWADAELLHQRLVQLEARVEKRFEPDGHHAGWDLLVDGRRVTARLFFRDPASVPEIVGKHVRVRGVLVLPRPSAAAPSTEGVELWIGRARDIEVVAPPPVEAAAVPRPALPTEVAPAALVPARLIRTLTDYWDVPVAERGVLTPADLELVIYYYDPGWNLLWAESGGVPAFVLCYGAPLPIRSGQRVRLEGHVVPGRGLTAEHLRVTVLDERVPIHAEPVAGMIGATDRFAKRVVVVQGLVDRQAEADGSHIEWDVISEGHAVTARMQAKDLAVAPEFEGRLVRMRGVYSPKIDPSGDLFGIDLWISALEDIEVIGTLDEDPRFDRPARPIETINALEGLVRMVGTVREFEPGRRVLIRDATGTLELQTLQAQPLRLGEAVEAVGYPHVSGLNRRLTSAIVRPLRATDSESRRLVAPAPQLRSAAQVLELAAAEASTGLPVRLAGLVTWSHPLADFLFLQDISGGVCVRFGPLGERPPAPGSAMEVTGVTAQGRYAPYVEHRAFEHRGAMILPAPQMITLEQAVSGHLEARWVEMRGYVTRVEREDGWNRLWLSASSGEFDVVLPATATLPPLVGAVIRARGVCEAVANDRRQLTRVRLWVVDAADLRLEEAAPVDPFLVPRQSIASLRRFSAVPVLNRWVRIQGTVLYQLPGRLLFLEEEGEGVLVSTRGDAPVLPGDVVEAAGLPGLEGERAVLREAVFRPVAGHAPAPVAPVACPPVLDAALDSRLVTLEGTLVSVLAQAGELVLAIAHEGAVFNAVLDQQHAAEPPAAWAAGSAVRLTGVYRISYDERSRPRSFRLQLRAPEDLVVVRPAPWWTAGRTLAVIALLFGGIVLGVLWALVLRRRVRHQTDLIREQVAKEANLEARNRSIVENASDFIFTADLTGRLTAFNPAGERITGYLAEEALRLNLRDLIASPADGVGAQESLRAEIGGGAAFQTRLRTKDGRCPWVEISSRFLSDEAGQPSGVLGIVRDISERKEFEQGLQLARDAAEASTRAKSAFLANMSHEIRTPMNGVIGMANLLLDTRLDPEQRDFAETIRASAESLLTVLNDILDFSKIEAGKLKFEDAPFALTETVEGALDLLAARAATQDLELAADLAEDLPQDLRGDAGRLRQVLLNLVGNAIKFTTAGEVIVHVGLAASTATEAELRFEVRDTGMGLTPEEAARLFQPFSQADESTTRRFGGTGLGLAICRQIVELMGGQIGVHSVKGEGATFWFTAKFQRCPSTLPLGAEPASPLRGRSALLVEDNATSARILTQCLSRLGVSCHTVADAAEASLVLAASAAAGRPLDFALVDAQLGRHDGISLATQLATLPGVPRVHTLLLTTVDRRLSKERLAAAAVEGQLTKPIHRLEVRAQLEALLGGRAQPGAATVDSLAGLAEPSAAAEHAPRALVVEDNSVNQRVARLALERLGFRVELAGNGREGLAALDRAPFDVVLMDCQMPEMDGYEATRRIRAGRHAALRVIAMTANAMEGDRERCREAGMDDYVSKPMRVPDLLAALERLHVVQPRAAV